MRRLGQEALVSRIAVIEPCQRIVDGRHQRQKLIGNTRHRHLDAALVIFDVGGMRGRVRQAREHPSNDDRGDDHGRKGEQ
ncbi:hypothetical protein D3C86_2063890 [compost metagenome]